MRMRRSVLDWEYIAIWGGMVVIIGLALVVAIPGFLDSMNRARQQTCIGNLFLIRSAKAEWQLENWQVYSRNTKVLVGWTELVPNFLKEELECPNGGKYSLNSIGEDPTCSEVTLGHILP